MKTHSSVPCKSLRSVNGVVTTFESRLFGLYEGDVYTVVSIRYFSVSVTGLAMVVKSMNIGNFCTFFLPGFSVKAHAAVPSSKESSPGTSLSSRNSFSDILHSCDGV